MARTLLCEIVTPERILYTNEVEFIVAPAADGEIGLLPLHQPLVSTLKAGEVRVRFDEKEWEWFAISGGYVQVHEDKAIILADDAVASSQIDIERVKQSAELCRAKLAELSAPTEELSEGSGVVKDLAWYEAQLEVAKRRT